MVGVILSISQSCTLANEIPGCGARSDIAPSVQGNVPNIVSRSNPFVQSEEDEWVKPQVLLEIAESKDHSRLVADSSTSKSQRPRKFDTPSEPISRSSTGRTQAQRDGVSIFGDGGGVPKPRLPPRPPTWQTAEHNSSQPIERSATGMHASTNLLDEVDPAMDKWKPLLPRR